MRSLLASAISAALLTSGCGRDLSAPAPVDWLPVADRPWDVLIEDACRAPEPPANTVGWSDSAPALESYCTTLWVTQGEDQVLTLWYADPGATPTSWFLRLYVPADAQLVDRLGRPVPDGVRVPVTVSVHPSLYAVRFGPHGARFEGRPAVLKVNYGWADLGTRGDDAPLSVYYQPDETADWTQEPTEIDRHGHFLCAELRHFSNYAVAF